MADAPKELPPVPKSYDYDEAQYWIEGWDEGYKRGLEDAAKILDLHDSVPCEPNEAWSDEVENAYVAAQIDAALSWQYAIRAKIRERDDG